MSFELITIVAKELQQLPKKDLKLQRKHFGQNCPAAAFFALGHLKKEKGDEQGNKEGSGCGSSVGAMAWPV